MELISTLFKNIEIKNFPLKFYLILIFFIRFLNSLIPKVDNQFVFSSIPDYSDNAKAFYEYIIHCGLNRDYQLIWILNDKERPINIFKGRCYQFYSLNGIKAIFRSKFIVCTHNNFASIKSNNQILVNLWHGTPLKSMGFVDVNSESYSSLKKIKIGSNAIDILIATSMVTKSALITSFFIDPRKVFITGQPRNDYLFYKTDENKLLSFFGVNIHKYEKVILYMPTFRKFQQYSDGEINYLEFLFSDILSSFIQENNILFLIKLHPFEEKEFVKKIENFNLSPNIRIVESYKLAENLLDIYNIINIVDILITDYSSIFFDYLLLTRPIIFYIPDISIYEKKRSFLLEPFNFWTPGPKVFNIEGIINEINNYCDNEDRYIKERQIINQLINKYQDSESSKRVFNIIRNYKKI